MPETAKRPQFYHNPPVFERVASVYADVPEELFEDRFDDWRVMVEADYPVYEPLKEWLILVEEKDDIPLLNTAHPELRITQRFSRKPSRERFDWSIRCPVGQFTMNMHSKPDEGQNRRYHHLKGEYEKWLPLWIEHFGIRKLKTLNLHYVNVLNRQTVPEFFSPNGGLQLNKLLTMFSSVPGEHECIIQPYECRVAVKLHSREESSFLIEVASMQSHGDDVAVKVDFVVQTPLSADESDAKSVLALLDWEHDHIVRRFEAVFTAEARASFKPERSPMIAAPVHLPPPNIEAAETRAHRSPREFKATEEPKSQIRQTFAFRKTVLQVEPGRLQLKLTTPPMIAVNPTTLECEVVGWEVSMPASEAENIPRAMTRRFLELFSKADAGKLEEHEQQCWVNILDQVDYQAFCIDRAAPHYMEGMIVARQPNFTRVEWHDGTRENLEPRVARSLAALEPDDEFGAFVKLGRDNKAMQIENVTILAPA